MDIFFFDDVNVVENLVIFSECRNNNKIIEVK